MVEELLCNTSALGVLISSDADIQEIGRKINRIMECENIKKFCFVADNDALLKQQEYDRLRNSKVFVLPEQVMKADILARESTASPTIKSMLEHWGVI